MPRALTLRRRKQVDDEPNPDVVDGIEYPSSDSKPFAETEIHALTIILLFQFLCRHYCKERTDVHVGANIMLYWEQGNPKEEKRRTDEEKGRADQLQKEVERLRTMLEQRKNLDNGKRNGSHAT